MKIKISTILYSIICNTPVSICLSLAGGLVAQSSIVDGVFIINFAAYDWSNVALNFCLAWPIAMIISIFIPLLQIGKWAAKLFKIRHDTFTNNMPYRLTAMAASSIVFTTVITPFLTIINNIILPLINQTDVCTFGEFWISLLVNYPIMYIVGYVSSLISDIFAFKAAKKIDPEF